MENKNINSTTNITDNEISNGSNNDNLLDIKEDIVCKNSFIFKFPLSFYIHLGYNCNILLLFFTFVTGFWLDYLVRGFREIGLDTHTAYCNAYLKSLPLFIIIALLFIGSIIGLIGLIKHSKESISEKDEEVK